MSGQAMREKLSSFGQRLELWLEDPDARRLVSRVFGCCWLVSLFLPVAVTPGPFGGSVPGWGVLVSGWLGPAMYQFGWYANLLLPFVLKLAAKSRRGWVQKFSVIVALAMGLLACNALFWDEIPGEFSDAKIAYFHVGYYLWLVVTFGGAIWGLVSAKLVLRDEDE
jgi:hypothetical protein